MTDHLIVRPEGHLTINDAGQLIVRSVGDCCCPGVEGDCGECTAVVPDDITLDLGTTGLVGNDIVTWYASNCDSPCAALTGNIVLTRRDLIIQTCLWQYEANPFCTISNVEGLTGGGYASHEIAYRLLMHAAIGWWSASLNWQWVVNLFLWSTDSGFYSSARYREPTTTTCTAKTYTLSRESTETNIITPPCVNGYGVFAWPTTVDLIIP